MTATPVRDDRVPQYSVGTWDTELQAYTPQIGMRAPCFNIDLWTLKAAMRELRNMGYSCHRFRDNDGSHEDNDAAVLIERTDGRCESEIMEAWRR